MTQVETLTGINAHTLRVWERRYDFLLPKRTQTNIRFYSDAQLKKLLNIGILIRNGYRISKIDKMPQAEIHKQVTEILMTHTEENHDRINGLVISMLEMDEEAFNKIFSNAVADSDFISTITNLIYPFLNLVGGLWITNKTFPAQEHFISNLIRQKILSAIEGLPTPVDKAKRILLFLLEGEAHEIGLLLAYYLAKNLGWRVYYLGQNVPSKNIGEICNIVNPNLMMTMFITPRSKKINSLISNVLAGNNIPLLYSGNPFNFTDLEPVKNAVHIKTPHDFDSQLKKY
jgi:DNA-binding transcriptional MerR regulator